MSEQCDNHCEGCSEAESCDHKPIEKEKSNELSRIKKVIAVMSGKGGVGKSLVSSLLAVGLRRSGDEVAIMDADITGPSIPKAFGLTDNATGDQSHIYAVSTKTGIKAISINLLVDDATAPIVWRGPLIAGAVKQFWTDVVYGDIDWMVVDMPPGTGDVPLTVFQSLPVDGIIVVTSPQDLVGLIVEKAVNMAKMMNVPLIGLVENMSYAVCPKCGERLEVFGHSHAKEAAAHYGIPLLDQIPLDAELANLCDKGRIEDIKKNPLPKTLAAVKALAPNK